MTFINGICSACGHESTEHHERFVMCDFTRFCKKCGELHPDPYVKAVACFWYPAHFHPDVGGQVPCVEVTI